MRKSWKIIFLISASLLILAAVLLIVSPGNDRTGIDALYKEAIDQRMHGRFEESNATFQKMLDTYKLTRRERKIFIRFMAQNAFHSGDYRAAAKYYATIREKDALAQTLAGLPPQSMERPDSDISVPFEIDTLGLDQNYHGMWIRVNAVIGGKRAQFVLDNGCVDYCFVTETFAKEHGVRPVGLETEAHFVGGTTPTWVGIADSLTVGELTFRNPLFQVVPDYAFDVPGLNLKAIMGSNFFRLAGEIQFLNKEHRIVFPGQQEDRDANLTVQGHIFVDVSIDGETLPFVLDLGSANTALNSDYLKRHKEAILATCPVDTIKIGAIGKGGIMEIVGYKVESVLFSANGGSFEKDATYIAPPGFISVPDSFGFLGADFILSFDKAVMNLQKMYLYVE